MKLVASGFALLAIACVQWAYAINLLDEGALHIGLSLVRAAAFVVLAVVFALGFQDRTVAMAVGLAVAGLADIVRFLPSISGLDALGLVFEAIEALGSLVFVVVAVRTFFVEEGTVIRPLKWAVLAIGVTAVSWSIRFLETIPKEFLLGNLLATLGAILVFSGLVAARARAERRPPTPAPGT